MSIICLADNDNELETPVCTVFLQTIMNGMQHGFYELSNAQKPSFLAIYVNVPEPLESYDGDAMKLYPWRALHNRCVECVEFAG